MSDLEVIAQGINLLWVLIATFLIFFMHAGFAMLEAGQVRSKNVANQLTKNLLTWSVGVMTFFLVGAALSSIVGHLTGATGAWSVVGEFAAILAPTDVNTWVDWLFGAVFAMTAATIVSGAVAGRCKLRTYVGYTILLAGVFYPVVVGFTWAGGFLSSLGFHDFAGGMIVHGMGGLAGLTAAWIIGPRLGRFEEDGTANVIPGHSVTFAALGTLILAFGWYGFNVGTAATVFSVENGTISLAAFETVGRVALITTLGMGAGTLGAGAVSLIRTGKVDTLYVANGLLAGLVGITAIADDIVWPGAIIVGLLAGAQLPFVFEFVEKRLQIDDVCAVFPVHGSAGILGTLVYPLVAVGTWQSFSLGTVLSGLAVQATGIAVIGLWIVGATMVVFGGARKLGQARVTPHHEKEGLDASEHGVETYPEFGHEGAHGVVPESLRTDGGRPNGGKIKLVTAIVRPDKLGDVKRGLAEVGAPSLTVTNVSGRGNQPAKLGQWRGEEYVVDLHQKVKVECVVADIPAEEVAEAIRDAATTGEPGDGKVFILPVEDAYQVRTGKQGQDAV